MENSFNQIFDFVENPYDLDFKELLRLTYHCYHLNPSHPFIAILQSFCIKASQETLSPKDQKALQDVFETFLLFRPSL